MSSVIDSVSVFQNRGFVHTILLQSWQTAPTINWMGILRFALFDFLNQGASAKKGIFLFKKSFCLGSGENTKALGVVVTSTRTYKLTCLVNREINIIVTALKSCLGDQYTKVCCITEEDA